MKASRLALVAFALAAAAVLPGRAQPSNDHFTNAWMLTGAAVSTNGNSSQPSNATRETGEPWILGTANIGGRSVWFSWTAPSGGPTRVDTAGSAFNTILGVYTGNAVSALSLVASNDNASGEVQTSLVSFSAQRGVTYRIVVDGRRFFSTGAASGAYNLNVRMLASVAVVSPTNGAIVPYGAPFPVVAEAEAPGGSIARVDFYQNARLIGALNTAPYTLLVSNAPLGTNHFFVVATDNSSQSWTSAVASVLIANPGLNITSPTDGATLLDTNPVTVSALAWLPSGALTNVVFFADGVAFGQRFSPPFSAVWSGATPGTHRLWATGWADDGNAYTSAPVMVAVAQVLLASNAVWKYLDDGSDQGTAWTAPGFNDAEWRAGPAELGYGDADEATVIGFGPDENNKYITYYFRRAFVATNTASFTNLVLRVLRDDGAVAYLNGVEVARYNMPAGAITYTTLTANATDDGTIFYPAEVPASLLVEGTNLLAIEIHQTTVTSSDLSFNLDLLGVPRIQRNQAPLISLTDPTHGASFLAPDTVLLTASASDPDPEGRVVQVEFFVGATSLGVATNAPFSVVWTNPPLGWHDLQAVATDDQGARGASTLVAITVYDAAGTPLVAITSPTDGEVFEGPTNLTLTARASAPGGVTNLTFLTNTVALAHDPETPYEFFWSNVPFGAHTLAAVACDATGACATSAPVRITVNTPPLNTNPPVIVRVVPAPGAALTNLTSLQVTFSERVVGVDAADLLLNGLPATAVTGSVSNYTFTVTPPPYGLVTVTWAANHAITDVGWPAALPFDATAPEATWTYDILDRVPPTIFARQPPAGAFLTNLTALQVTFSEPVRDVDASDLLINGVPAFTLSGGGSNYLFGFSQPPSGPVTISWASTHDIADLASPPNPFNAGAAGATWSYTLDARTILVQSNSAWLFLKGVAEASSPVSAWRQRDFDDTGWSNALAPFYYGDPYDTPGNPGTLLSDMQGGYSSIYLRRAFVVNNLSAVTNLLLAAQSDDGFIAWINGVEVVRYNVPGGELPYNGGASSAVTELTGGGTGYTNFALAPPAGYLVEGANLLAVHAFNQSLAGSSDFGFNAQLSTWLADASVVEPRLLRVSPPAGEVFALSNVTVDFTEPVTGVDAADLLVNGQPATGLTSPTNTTYTFAFQQPPYGPVAITWATNHGILDLDAAPKPFGSEAPGSTWQYTLANPNAPVVASQSPVAGATLSVLTQIVVTFSKPVTNVDAADLRLNGLPATGLSSQGDLACTFTFDQPAYGPVSVAWITNHGITDLEVPPNAFDAGRPANRWTYTLVDETPPAIASQDPPAGTRVTNLTQITVTFTEPVAGVDAADLLINGAPASLVTGAEATWTFSFAQPNATAVRVTWANNHGIRDVAEAPNGFDASAPGATWSYTTADNVPPGLTSISPPAGVTLRSLAQITITFTEPVAGVQPADLLINNLPARTVTGAGAGPYTFSFLQPPPGPVEVRWAPMQAITDLATPPNPFAGGEWTYILDPDASFAGQVLINEIMFNPMGGRAADEWIELHNVSTNLINLTGWRFTRGVSFTFPNVAIPGGGYVVAAADVAAFQTKYPAGSNVVGGWTGSLANSDETLELATATGEVVHNLHYASEGDWARRDRATAVDLVTSITRVLATATVTIFDHGYTANDQVLISGADQPEYNGRFTIGGITRDSFTITVPGSPASPATGQILCRQVVDNGQTGWSWFCPADGFGSSLELIHPARPTDCGQNWLSSSNLHGTPGQANSVRATNVAPFIEEVTHFPPVPRSTDAVAITARVSDELSNGVQAVTLFYRNHTTASPGAFGSTNLLDDGTRRDGVAGDGLFGAVLPPAANGAVIEFYVQATDTTGLTRTWPAPSWNTNNTLGQFANALYQVDNENIATNNMPSMRLVLSGTEGALFPPSDRNGDSEMNCTLVATDGGGTAVRYLGGVRVRGAGTRSRTPPNNRLNIPTDRRWNGQSAFNLNGQFIHASLVGNVLAQKSGATATDAHVVQYRINGVNPAPITAPVNGSGNGAGWGTFVMLKPVAGDLLADLYPQDPDGNVYRASTGNHNADLSYQGTNPVSYLNRGYAKTSNRAENDWTDLMQLCAAFTAANTPDNVFVETVATNINVQEWMTYFAVGSLVNYGETSLFNGRGDDYALYRGEHDRRFVLIGHDFDTIFGQGDTGSTYYPINTNSSIYIMINPPNPNSNVPNLRRLMTNNAFAPLFYGELKRLCDTVFHPSQLNPLLDQLLTGWGVGPDAATITAMKNYAANRRAVVLSQIPLTLTVGHRLALSNGLPYTTTPTVTLFGQTHAIDTRRVLVNGTLANWTAFDARWTNTLTLPPGVNRVLVQSLDSNNVEFARTTVDIWYDDQSVQNVSGTLSADTAWSAAGGPYNVTANLTVANGVTLTIQPGTTIYLGSGVNFTVAGGGRLLAEGTATAPIRFTRAPDSAATWGGITINGAVASPTNRLAHVHIEGNGSTAIHSAGGTVFLDHLTFGNTAVQYLSLDNSSFVVQDCVFPAATAYFEPVHGTGGLKGGGQGLFLRNFFGAALSTSGNYNDVVDFSGGQRPGSIVQFIGNVFTGSGDDHLDLDSTDAWIEGNLFLHAHQNGSPDTASGVSGGSDTAEASHITIIGNLFYDCDQAALAKQSNFYTLLHNTIVRQTRQGGTDTDAAVVALADAGTAPGAGMWLEGNVLYDIEKLVRNLSNAVVTFTNNLMPLPWSGPGGGNVSGDPLFQYVPALAETSNFTSWAQAQVMWEWFRPRPGSPALGAGPNGRDWGAVPGTRNPELGTRNSVRGVSLSGEPASPTPRTTATLTVGLNRTGNGIPSAGWPEGSGYTHYRWRLDGGVWSAPVPIATPLALSGLSPGPHQVEVSGRNDAGLYQDDPVLGADAVTTWSRAWVVDPAASPVRLSEILASNGGAVNHFGTTPDCVELYNASDEEVDLAGLRLTDDPANPDKFIFPGEAVIGPREYLVLFANNPDGTPGLHLGFNLNADGDGLYLFHAPELGGALLDSVAFGLQLRDLSIGRVPDGAWALTSPTFGAPNRAAPVGDPTRLRINEWLALGRTPFPDDFVELYNPDPLPVSLGGLYLSDEILGWPDRHRLAALSFMAGGGYLRLLADGQPERGPAHLSFRLNHEQGAIGLYLPDLTLVDCVFYQPQRPGVSQGRSPNGGSAVVFFDTPTPGAPNPRVGGVAPFGGALVVNEVLATGAPDWVEVYNGTTNPVSLAGLSLTDDVAQPRRWVWPAGAEVGPGGFLRVDCDGSRPVSATSTGFGLKAVSGAVYLFDTPANGGSLLSSVTYGLQIPGLTIGRVPDGSTNWGLTTPSPETNNVAVPTLGDRARLRVNEWMAGPYSGDDWFEVYNPESQPVALGGLHLTDDLNNRTKHTIVPLSFIGTGTNAWRRFYATGSAANVEDADQVGFALRLEGEAVGVSAADGTLIDGYAFGQQLQGVSEGRFPDGSPEVVKFPGTESPGAANYRWLATVAISEVLTHTDPPLEDAIELHNLTGAPVDVGGWWLSDDPGLLQKYQIPAGTLLAPYGFTVIYETSFTNRDQAAQPFALSSKGDETVLSATTNGALTGYRTHVRFGAADNGVSFGRYLTSDSRTEFVALSQRTFGVDDPATVEEFRQGAGASNAYPRVGPVVISEIMYHPPDLGTNDNVRDEYLELRNITTAPVPLFDPARPTNTWHLRDAVDFDFPTNVTLAGGEYLLVVSFDPVNNHAARAAFTNQYRLAPGVRLLGPYDGKLANSTDEIELRKPGDPEDGDVPYVLVERVRYYDTWPWPPLADGTGLSLHRLDHTAFGNDPINWEAATPTPGPQAAPLDFDQDGMLDSWEIANGLDPFNPADAAADLDRDGLTNLQEFQAGTDPRDPRSTLAVALTVPPGPAKVSFLSVSNRTYTVQLRESPAAGAWYQLASLTNAEGPTGLITVPDPFPATRQRVYRVVTPALPATNLWPIILENPAYQTARVGQQARFSLLVVGTGPLQYQWLYEETPLAGEVEATLLLTNLTGPSSGRYSVRVTDAAGTATSEPGLLLVAPEIIAQPYDQVVDVGGAARFDVLADGTPPLEYRWYHNHRFLADATNATLVLANVQPAQTGTYHVVVRHLTPGGPAGTASRRASLVVSPSGRR